MIEVTLNDAKALVVDTLKAELVPMLVSSPGVGKSSLAREIAKDFNLQLIDVRLSQSDPSDLNGYPFMKENGKAGYVPMDMFPIEGDTIPEGYDGWLVLLDEINSASPAVQSASYKVILDKMVGQHKLHPKVAIIAAGNKMTDKAIVNRTGTAMQSRLIHLNIRVDHEEWIKWADHNEIDHRVKSFLNFKPEALHKFDPNHNEDTFPCPRTYEFLSRLIKSYKFVDIEKLPLMAGAIGEGMAREFFGFTKIYGELPTIQSILTNPENIDLSPEPGIQYALSGLIGYHLKESTVEPLMKFLQRLDIDFQVITLRSAIARNISLRQTDAVKAWVSKHAAELA